MIETVIERIQGEPHCIVYTGEKPFIRQLKKYRGIEVIPVGDGHVKAKVPADWLRFVAPPQKTESD